MIKLMYSSSTIKNFSNIQIRDIAISQLKKIIEFALNEKKGEMYLIQNLNCEIIAGAFFLVYFNRIYYLVSFSSEEGKKTSAMFWLIDKMIQKYAQKDMVLDFEGSTIPGIAKFMKGWGAELVMYPRYCKNYFKIFQSR